MKIKAKKKTTATAPVPPPPPVPLPHRAALVYQHNGWCTVAQVETHSRLVEKRGRTRIIFYGLYLEGWRVAETLAYLGWEVATYACPPNAGLTHRRADEPPKLKATDVNWSKKFQENPNWDLMTNRIVENLMGVPRPLTKKGK